MPYLSRAEKVMCGNHGFTLANFQARARKKQSKTSPTLTKGSGIPGIILKNGPV